MKLEIIHDTLYEFSHKIFLEPHYLRFLPADTPYCRVEHFTIEVLPKPAGFSQLTNMENNMIHFAWFNDQLSYLDIKARSVVHIEDYNPFNFIIYPSEHIELPVDYSKHERRLLSIYLEKGEITQDLMDWGHLLTEQTSADTMSFLSALTSQIHHDFNVESRTEGAPHDPITTFKQKKGSCRDLSWMQIHLLRNLGLAARFVSGYHYIDADDPEFELHAWLEVYIPGGGWIGFDPTHGMATGNTHIPVARNAHYIDTMPVSGTFRGSATSRLKTYLDIRVIN